MQDFERLQRDYYHQVINWLRENEITKQTGMVIIALFLLLVAIIVATYFAFSQQNLQKQNFQLDQQNQTLSEQLSNIEFEQSSKETELSYQVKQLERNLSLAEKSASKKLAELTKVKASLSQAKALHRETSSSLEKQQQVAKLNEYKLSQHKRELTQLTRENEKIHSDYLRVNTQLTALVENQQRLQQQVLLSSISPIWFEPSEYFNNQAVIAVYVNQNSQLYQFIQDHVEYIYYKIDDVKTDSGSEVFRPISVDDKRRGLYFLVYAKDADEWQGKEKYAYIKLKGNEEERVITFY